MRIKSLLTGIFLLLIITSTQAQNTSITYAQNFGGSDWDEVITVVTDANANMYLAGTFKGTAFFNNDTLSSNGNNDIFILKLNASGDLKWVKAIGGSSNDAPTKMILNHAGNLILAGTFQGTSVDFDPGPSVFNLSSAGSTDCFVLELDTMGTFVMAKSFGGTSNEVIKDIDVDASDNIYTYGSFSGTCDFDPSPGNNSHTSQGDDDVFIQKLSSTGSLSWIQSIGGTSQDEAADIAVTDNGDIYFAGGYRGTVDFDPDPTNAQSHTATSSWAADAFVAKFNTSGQYVWVKVFGSYDGLRVFGMDIDGNENVYTTGDFFMNVDFDPSAAYFYLVSNMSGNDVFLQKLNKNGDFVWAKSYGGSFPDISNDIHVDNKGNVYTLGQYGGAFDVNPNSDSLIFTLNGFQGDDVYIQKLDSLGAFVWASHFGGTWFDEGAAITTDVDGNIIVVGSFESDTLNLNSPTVQDLAYFGGLDGYVVKFEQAQTLIDASITNFTAPPFNVTFTNNTTDTSNVQWFWNYGDGSFSTDFEPTHNFPYNGTYDVELLAVNSLTNQADTASIRISCSGGTNNPCNFTAEILQEGAEIICPTDSFKLTATPGAYAYNWYFNGVPISGANDSVLYAQAQGYYLAVVSNSACSQASNFFLLANYPTITPTIYKSGSITPCTNDSMTLMTDPNYVSYLWSTGESGTQITTKLSGRYTVIGTDNIGCQHKSIETIINASLADIPDICVVAFDQTSNSNVVTWSPITDAKIDSVRVYRESHIANKYMLIGSESVNGLNYVVDNNSNVAVRQYRYRIALVDTCGTVSPTSEYHASIHLMVNAAMNDHWNLIWTPYVGLPVSSYKIYRGTDSLSMTLLTTLPGSNTSFTDLNNPTGNIYYMIEAVTAASCGTYSIPKSNTFNTANANGVGVQEIENEVYSIKIYPNPNQGHFYVDIDAQREMKLEMSIYNSVGQLIQREEFNNPSSFTQKVDINSFSYGVYFIRITSANQAVYSGKIIVQ